MMTAEAARRSEGRAGRFAALRSRKPKGLLSFRRQGPERSCREAPGVRAQATAYGQNQSLANRHPLPANAVRSAGWRMGG